MNEPLSAVKKQRPAGQLVRYALVGLASNLSGYLVYLLITYYGVEPKAAMTLVYVVGATTGFFGNRLWTFAHKGAALKSGIRYGMAHLLGYALNFLILSILVDRLGYAHQWVQAAAIGVVAGFLFILFRGYVFAATDGAPEKS